MKEINGVYYGFSSETAFATDEDDLTIFNAVDTGKQYRAFNGRWFEQPVVWSDDPDSSGGSGGGSDPVSPFPDLPITDGEYSLLLTVDDGEPVLTWEPNGETPT